MVTDDGRVTVVRLEQPWNELWDISVTDEGMLMEDSRLQFMNAVEPVDVNELLNVTDVRLRQPLKALPPIVVTLSGMTIEVIADSDASPGGITSTSSPIVS